MTTPVVRLLRGGAVVAGCVLLLLLWGAAGRAEEGSAPPDESTVEPAAAAEVVDTPDAESDETAVPEESGDADESTSESGPSEVPAEEPEEPELSDGPTESDEGEPSVTDPAPAPEAASAAPESAAVQEDGEAAQPQSEETPDVGCPECSSNITQTLIDKVWDTDHWNILIEATLNSNVVCHTLLFQCVVQPEQEPEDMTLVSVSCMAAGWVNVIIDVFGFHRDVCARFDGHRAGQDQKFQFEYATEQAGGQVSETVEFFRFPEEIIFPPRAQNTITIDLDVRLLLTKECPDTVEAGTTINCTITVQYPDDLSGPAVANPVVTDTIPPEFTDGSLSVSEDPENRWDCETVPLQCSADAVNRGETWTFILTAGVDPNADGLVTNVVDLSYFDGPDEIEIEASDDVTIYRPVDTLLAISKGADQAEVAPGGPVSFTIIVENRVENRDLGSLPNDAVNVVVTDVPPVGLLDPVLTFVSGVGAWQCSGLMCTAATMPVGTAIFQVLGTVDPSLPNGAVLVNEVDIRWENDVFGPDFTERAGAATVVNAVVPPTPSPVVPAEETARVVTAGLPFTGVSSTGPIGLIALIALLVGGGLVMTGRKTPSSIRDVA